MVQTDSLDNLTNEEMLSKLSLEEEISRIAFNATPNKNLESTMGFYTPFFKEKMEEKKIYTPFSPTKCKSLISSNQQRYNAAFVNPKKLDFSNFSINQKKRKRVGDG